jgi:hypothetical protein
MPSIAISFYTADLVKEYCDPLNLWSSREIDGTRRSGNYYPGEPPKLDNIYPIDRSSLLNERWRSDLSSAQIAPEAIKNHRIPQGYKVFEFLISSC